MNKSEEELIAQYIERNPHKPWPSEARLKRYAVPVWALVGDLPAAGGDTVQVAKDYDVPLEAVKAAFAYYRRFKTLIDARLAENELDAV